MISMHTVTAARSGHAWAVKELLRIYAHNRGWTSETLRARWDGARKLLAWWHQLDPPQRPPLDDLTTADAQQFLDWLEAQHLAKSTLRNYRKGARATVLAVRVHKPKHDPFANTCFVRIRPKVPQLNRHTLLAVSPLIATKLEALVALMALGLRVSEVCALTWQHIDIAGRNVDVRGQRFTLGITALEALEQLQQQSSTDRLQPWCSVLRWQPDTARRWLKRCRQDLSREQ